MTTYPMREAFEREVLQKRGWKNDYTVADGVFKYTHHQVQQAYEVWQAALSQPRMTEEEAVELMARAAINRKTKIPRRVLKNGKWIKSRMSFENCPQVVLTRVTEDMKAAYRALLGKLPAQVDDWQTIETAPKDDTQIILYSEKYHKVTTGVWGHYYHHNEPRFTRWQPLPKPPTN